MRIRVTRKDARFSVFQVRYSDTHADSHALATASDSSDRADTEKKYLQDRGVVLYISSKVPCGRSTYMYLMQAIQTLRPIRSRYLLNCLSEARNRHVASGTPYGARAISRSSGLSHSPY